jgi:hypothetical protein
MSKGAPTGSKEVRARHKRLLNRRIFKACRGLFISGIYCGAWLWVPATYFLATPNYKSPVSQELTDEQRKWDSIVGNLPPMDVVIHFQTPKEFKAYRAKKGWAKPAIAYANYNNGRGNVCEITMQSGIRISAEPSIPTSGEFVDQHNADTLAHELLHCFAGRWHSND